jgi:hypothetical protein
LEEERRTLEAQAVALQSRIANLTAQVHLAANVEKNRAVDRRRRAAQMGRARKAD